MKQSHLVANFKIKKIKNGNCGYRINWRKELIELYEDVMGDHFVINDLDLYLSISDMYLLIAEVPGNNFAVGGFMRVMKVDSSEDEWFKENTTEKEIVVICEIVSRVKGGGRAFINEIKKYQTDVFITSATNDSIMFYEKMNFTRLESHPDLPGNDSFILRIDKTTDDYKRKQKAIEKRYRKGNANTKVNK